MRKSNTRAQHTQFFFKFSAKVLAIPLSIFGLSTASGGQTIDTIPPTPPTGLVATASSCGQVDLSWGASTDNVGGSGLKAYTIYRSDGVNTSIGAARTSFSDTNWVRSATTLTYYVVAQDNAGNQSSQSNSVTVVTPSCSTTLGEQVADSSSSGPLGKSMAKYGTRTALLYQKLNMYSTSDTWLYLSDSDTGSTSRFLLHSSPGYNQVETDYVLTSATELWTLSGDLNGGKLLVSQYQLNGTPPTSATLLSTKSLGDAFSFGKSLIALQSGGLAAAWSDEGTAYTGDLIAGYAYHSTAGTWIVKTPATLASSGGVSAGWKTRMILAQHPVDSSVWMFVKEDTSTAIEALHFTESTNDFNLDWINASFISQAVRSPSELVLLSCPSRLGQSEGCAVSAYWQVSAPPRRPQLRQQHADRLQAARAFAIHTERLDGRPRSIFECAGASRESNEIARRVLNYSRPADGGPEGNLFPTYPPSIYSLWLAVKIGNSSNSTNLYGLRGPLGLFSAGDNSSTCGRTKISQNRRDRAKPSATTLEASSMRGNPVKT